MDAIEEMEFWREYYGRDEGVRRRLVLIVEHAWATKLGFVIELTVRRQNIRRKETAASAMSSDSNTSSQRAFNVDLVEINIEKRLLYYVSPANDQMIRISFPPTAVTPKAFENQRKRRATR